MTEAHTYKSKALIGAIDEGTSSARFILFDACTFQVVAFHQETLELICPREGWVEQKPQDILRVVNVCIDRAVDKLMQAGGQVEDIKAIGVTTQRETTLVWDKYTGEPLYNAIVWSDVRTTSTVEYLLDQVPNKTCNQNYLKPLCGLPLSPYFSAVKLRWLYDNIADVKRAIDDNRCLFGTVDTWIIWNLTGGKSNGLHVTDVTNASRTMLMNIDSLQWDAMLLKFFDLKPNILPNIRSSAEIYGPVVDGVLKHVVISSCVGDQQSALIGQRCLSPGQVKATYGTGCFLLCNTGHRRVDSSHGLISTVAYQLGKKSPAVYALEGSVAVAGSAISWLKTKMELVDDEANLANIVTSDTCNDNAVYFVPAFSGLFAPYWQKDARGVICGINEDTTSTDIIRATLEAVCFQIRDIVESMNKDGDTNVRELKVDGGMTNNRVLMQIQSNLIGLSVKQAHMKETTALGAAMLAAHAIGLANIDSDIFVSSTEYVPKITENQRDLRYHKWKMAVERSSDWV